jgi:hypothetical protein
MLRVAARNARLEIPEAANTDTLSAKEKGRSFDRP